jgi:hypothetical protein
LKPQLSAKPAIKPAINKKDYATNRRSTKKPKRQHDTGEVIQQLFVLCTDVIKGVTPTTSLDVANPLFVETLTT